jgi:epsilon-lactone hydrolase
MAIKEAQAMLEVPARLIPVPTSLSPEARAYLGRDSRLVSPGMSLEGPEDRRGLLAAVDQIVLATLTEVFQALDDRLTVNELSLDGLPVFDIRPPDYDPKDPRVYLDLHGGAFTVGGRELSRATGIVTAAKVGMRVWSVDYRTAPDHLYPAAVDDCLVAYQALLQEHRPEEIVVGGESAGGNLSAATILRARDEGLRLPAATILLTAVLDLTQSGDTFRTNLGVDTVITTDDAYGPRLYAGRHDLKDPFLSPLFGDMARGFPPTLLASGTRDVLLSDSVRMHRKLRAAGVPAELHVLEAAPHGFFGGGTPEEQELDREIRRFIDDYCPLPRG